MDFSDPMVREMANRNHVPCEIWLLDGTMIPVSCGQCGQAWPCETRQQLRALRDWVE